MKFLHAADIHLDSPLTGLGARKDLPDAVIRNCTRRAFTAMIDLALQEDVAFVIIAGDLYDGDWKDFSTGLFFAAEMRRLDRPCFLLRGNHDARSVITKNLAPPPNVREFSSRTCETFALDALGVALHGHSFPNRAVPEDLSASYRPRIEGMFNIGVLHTSADDPGPHETYAPCRAAELALKGYDYWALGHIHARRVLGQHPWILFPGNLQGRHSGEPGAKGCTLVTVENRRVTDVAHRVVDVLRWVSLEIDATGADPATLANRISDTVLAALGTAGGRPLLGRLTLRGTADTDGACLADREQLAAIASNAAIAAGGKLWVESVDVRGESVPAATADTLAPLRTAFLAGLDDEETMRTLLQDLAQLAQKLPAPARKFTTLPQDAASLRVLADEAWQLAANAVRPGGET